MPRHAFGSRLRTTGAGPLDLLPVRARPAWLRSDAAFAAAYGAAAALTVFFLPFRTEAFIYFQFWGSGRRKKEAREDREIRYNPAS